MKSDHTGELHKSRFGDDFKWGVSTAAYQIEGGHDADGKGPSIWDVFCTVKDTVYNGHHGATACDFYNRYSEDIRLLKELGIPNFRFSLSWARIIPEGTGAVNSKGIDYYNKVIDACLENGIEPWVTLYHWDLPHALELQGGWTNRNSIEWFEEYADVCARHFGDRVKHWIVMNEPMAFTGAGYFLGLHAPGKKGLKSFLPAVHHTVLATSAGAGILRKYCPKAEIGTTFSCSHIEPKTFGPKDIAAANRIDLLMNRLFAEPLFGLGYPIEELPVLKKLRKYMLPGDEELMPFDFDFIGVQNYTREIVRYHLFIPYLNASLVEAKFRNVPMTEMGWEVYPPALYHVLQKFGEYKQIRKIYVTENGAAFNDTLQDGKIEDHERVNYIQEHLKQVLKAKEEGVNVQGYFVWTLLDNFEWAEGYRPKFGLVHVDPDTLERTVKESGYWYRDFLKG